MTLKGKHWGEFEENDDEPYMPILNFNGIIEAALQPNPELIVAENRTVVELPVNNISLQTVHLVEHDRQVSKAIATGEIPPAPPNDISLEHDFKPNISSEISDLDQIKHIAPLGTAARQIALTQAAAIILTSQPGVVSATKSVLDTLVGAVDQFLQIITNTMRVVVDREASNYPSGFPDIMTKVFTELGITNLHQWYLDNVVANHESAQRGFVEIPVPDVPQLHFPANLEDLSDSLGPGFQMLRTLESCQLPALHLLDGDSDNIDFSEDLIDEGSPSTSPTAKKRKKSSQE